MLLQVPASVSRVCAILRDAGFEALAVGGAVRDALRGDAPKDWDVATSAKPDDVVGLFRRTIPTGIQHGTVTVVLGRGDDRMAIEVTTFRGEGAYSDARRPDSVTFGVPLVEDLARRDFTVNAIAYDPLVDAFEDPFGGRQDLAARVVRAVGDPAARFGEDGLRVMRAVRFVAVLEFALDPATEAAIPSARASLARVSRERVRDELLKLLGARAPGAALAIAERTGIRDEVVPELAPIDAGTAAAIDALPRDAALRLAALLRPLGERTADAIGRRLRLSNDERARITHAIRHSHPAYDPMWTDARVRAFVAEVRPEALHDVFALAPCPELEARAANVVAAGDPLYLRDLAIGGGELMQELGMQPGRAVGELLGELLERVLHEPALNERATLLRMARELRARGP